MNKHSRIWSLQEAKAKFSEVVRLAQTEGPQLVTVHGKEAVTIVAAGSAAAGRDEDTGAGLSESSRILPCVSSARTLSGGHEQE
jgi:prevent-host-death family protein